MEFTFVRVPQPVFDPTSVIRVGNAVIDTGHVNQGSGDVMEQLRKNILVGAEQIIITHPHVDHVSNSAALPELAQRPHVVFEGAQTVMENLPEYLRLSLEEAQFLSREDPELSEMMRVLGNVVLPWDREYHKVKIERVVHSGDEISVGDGLLKVIHTPGHEANHMALLDESSRTLFSGDLVRNSGYFLRVPLTSNIADYERSLRALLELDLKLIVPSHGDVIDDPQEHLKRCLQIVQDIKEAIPKTLQRLGEASHLDLAKELFGQAERLQMLVMAWGIWAYLEHLQSEGRVILDKEAQRARLP